MNMLFQDLLFNSLNLHVQHHEYIITSIIFTIAIHIAISYQAIKQLMSRYTVHEDRLVQNHEMFRTLHSFNLYISYFLKNLAVLES